MDIARQFRESIVLPRRKRELFGLKHKPHFAWTILSLNA
jgi:hypothetical protein